MMKQLEGLYALYIQADLCFVQLLDACEIMQTINQLNHDCQSFLIDKLRTAPNT